MENYRVILKTKCPCCNEVGYYNVKTFFPSGGIGSYISSVGFSPSQSHNKEERFRCHCGEVFITDKYDVIYR